ncbi:response regulator [uncultured Robinsoniella sp.]|uniref:response regulator transcription factor n=1 Tax=uncultured Robinsoniella sp. TaxID=904190 RepID=UPI00374E695C
MIILVADDERWIRKGIIKMIDQSRLEGDTQILEADTVEGALELFSEHRPQIVISDVKFPIEDGCTLCERIYAIEKRTRIIMISGYDEFEYVKRALAYRAVDYLLKPVDKQLLNNTIHKCVEELSLESQKNNRMMEEASNGELQMSDTARSVDIQAVIEDIEATILKNYSEKYTLSGLALKYHISEAYLSTVFKKRTGISLTAYIMQIKVERAKELMMTTQGKIWDIAAQVGYPDQHYFTKVFKKVTGESPTEYKVKLNRELYGEEHV